MPTAFRNTALAACLVLGATGAALAQVPTNGTTSNSAPYSGNPGAMSGGNGGGAGTGVGGSVHSGTTTPAFAPTSNSGRAPAMSGGNGGGAGTGVGGSTSSAPTNSTGGASGPPR